MYNQLEIQVKCHIFYALNISTQLLCFTAVKILLLPHNLTDKDV